MNLQKILMIILFQCSAAQVLASDLLEVYEWARANDPLYQAAILKYKGDLLTLDMSKSRTLPNVNYNYRIANNQRSSDQSTIDAHGADFQDCPKLDANLANVNSVVTCYDKQLHKIETINVGADYLTTQHSLVLTQNIYDASISADEKKAGAFIQKGKSELLDAEKDLIVRVVEGYIGVLKAKDEKEFVRLQLEAVEAQQIIAKKKYVLGIGKETEIYDAQAAYDALLIATEAVSAQNYLAFRNLSNITGVDMSIVFPVSEDMPVEFPEEENTAEWVKSAINKNDAILAARAGERTVYYDYLSRDGAKYPKVNFAASYSKDDVGDVPTVTSTIYGIGVQIPIYQGGGMTATSKQASYRLEEARERLSALQKITEAAIITGVVTLQTDVKRYVAGKKFVKSAQDALDATTRGYQKGAVTLLDLFNAQKKYYQAKKDLAASRYDYIEHKFKLEKAAGTLTTKQLSEINAWFQPPSSPQTSSPP